MRRWSWLAMLIMGCSSPEPVEVVMNVGHDAALDVRAETTPEAAPQDAAVDGESEEDAADVDAGEDAQVDAAIEADASPCPAGMFEFDELPGCYDEHVASADDFNGWLPSYQTPDGGACLALWADAGPVAFVPWCQAQAYCAGQGASLCTTSQWTAACFPWSATAHDGGGAEWILDDEMTSDWSTCAIPAKPEAGALAAIRCCKVTP